MLTSKDKCNGCHACFSICPKNCISMKENSEGFLYPEIDKSLCISCGKCTKICPVINNKEINNKPVAYAAYNKNEQTRLSSSSGGIFSLLAEWVTDKGGVVFGTGFDTDFSVIHSFAETKEELQKFRGSKYVQSQIGDSYKLAKEFLDNDRFVLFTGTPCQIGGLKAFLGKEYKNLFTQDLICHGVPSPKVWKKYIKFREKQTGSSTNKISFRDKSNGWKKYSVNFSFNNDKEYKMSANKDIMIQAFLKNICLRKSCYKCAYKTIHRQSDITLADFWGIENVLPHMDDNKGTSLIIINTENGKKLFNEINDYIVYESVDLHKAIMYNTSAIESVAQHKKRYKFFLELDKKEFDRLIKKYCSDPNVIIKIAYIIKNKRVKEILKRIFKR